MELKLEQVIIRDEDLVVFLPLNPCVEGELVVAPIHAFKTLEELPDVLVEKMFQVTNKMSSSLFDLLGCQGTNLLIQNGVDANQSSDSLFIRIIPRFENDSLKFDWSPSPASPEDLEGVVSSLKGFDEDKDKEVFEAKQREEALSSKEPESIDSSEDNYLLKSLRRNP